MRLGTLTVVVLSLGAPPCQETNPAFDAASTGTSVGDASSGGSTASSPATTSGSAEDSSGPAPGDSTSSPPPPDSTTSADAGDSGDPPGETSSDASSGDGGPADDAYPPCQLREDPPCPRPYDQCYDFLAPEFTVCSQTCDGDGDCPRPGSGTAEPVCAGPGDDQCVLDCGGGASCPAGMSCEMFGGGNIRRCVWPG